MNFKSKDEFQRAGLKLLKENNYTGTIVADTGSAKSKIVIDTIREGKFSSILIASPRTTLKENWKKELEKWNIKQFSKEQEDTNYFLDGKDIRTISIDILNVQTAYKYDGELAAYDLIVVDEVHTVGEKYFNLISKAKEYSIPCICLTATPNDEKDEFKRDILYKEVPILLRYESAEEDGIVNSTKYWVYEYSLDNNTLVEVKAKNKVWDKGELDQYNYLQGIFEENKEAIEKMYFSELKSRILERIEDNGNRQYRLVSEDIDFLNEAVSRDLQHYYSLVRPRYTDRDMSSTLYHALKDAKGVNYAALGTRVITHLTDPEVPDIAKPYMARYSWAMNQRRKLLWSLNSSYIAAVSLKNRILEESSSVKVLLFSELTGQADKLSENRVHSNIASTTGRSVEINQATIDRFNRGEIRDMSSVRSLQLGMNLTGATHAIFESYSGSKVNAKQSKGRLNRLPVEDVANIIIIRPVGTQMGEVWFKEAFGWIGDYTVVGNIEDVPV